MQPSSKAIKSLRRTLGGVSIVFMAMAGVAPATADADTRPTGTTTLTTILDDIQDQANTYAKTKPRLPEVLIINNDYVKIQTRSEPIPYERRLFYYMQSTVPDLPHKKFSSIRLGMGSSYGPSSLNPQAFHLDEQNKCVVIAENADLSSQSLVEKWIGEAGKYRLTPTINPGPYMMMKRSVWHEVWHCLDQEFVVERKKIHKDAAFERALAIHRSEMFADVAATLTMAAQGDHAIMQQTADIRAVSSRWKAPEMMSIYRRESDAEFYTAAIYYTTPGHDAAMAHIRSVGSKTLKSYSLNDIGRIAADITHKHALKPADVSAMVSYLGTGKGSSTFINEYKARTEQAKARVTVETRERVIMRPDNVPPSIDDILNRTSKTEKQAIHNAFARSIAEAAKHGQVPLHGVMNQLEVWRHALHNDEKRRPDLERKLYIGGLMLGQGLLDSLIRGKNTAQAPSPSP